MTEQKDKANFEKTKLLKESDVSHAWFIFDATGKTLGRLASEIAKILRGKHRPTYTPHADGGDGVIIIHAEKIYVSGNKEAQKVYQSHSGFIGGLRTIGFRKMREKQPEYIIEHAVKGMMPKNRLTRKQMKRLRIFAGGEHNMQAQQPTIVNI